MARLASDEKFGFFKTPDSIINKIADKIELTDKTVLFDPCCGDSSHIEILQCKSRTATYYGVELEESRYIKSTKILDDCINANAINDIEIKRKFVDILFLNPPYGTVQDGYSEKRLESLFLSKYISTLKSGGLLILIIKVEMLRYYSIYEILKHFDDIEICRFDDETYSDFNQVIFFGIKKTIKTQEKNLDYIFQAYDSIYYNKDHNIDDMSFYKKASKTYQIFGLNRCIESHKIEKPEQYIDLSNKFNQEFINIKVAHKNKIQPITNVRQGHLGMLMASGMMNGKILRDNFGNFMLIKGTLKHEETQIEEVDDNNNIKKTLKYTKPIISCFNLSNSVYTEFE